MKDADGSTNAFWGVKFPKDHGAGLCHLLAPCPKAHPTAGCSYINKRVPSVEHLSAKQVTERKSIGSPAVCCVTNTGPKHHYGKQLCSVRGPDSTTSITTGASKKKMWKTEKQNQH
jgi:hypothetical protein